MSNVQLFGFDNTNKQFNPVHIDSSGALSTTASIDTTGLATEITLSAISTGQGDGSQISKIRGDDSGTARDIQVDTNGKLNVNAAVTSVTGTVTVDGSGVTQPVSGSVGVTGTVTVDGSGVTQPVSGAFYPATQPMSAASLPLPTGAATETSLALIAGCENGGGALQVDIQADGVGIATSALQTAGNASLTALQNCIDTGVNEVAVVIQNDDIGLATSAGQTSLETKVGELNDNAFDRVQETVTSLSTARGSALNCTNYARVELLVERDSTSTATGMAHVQLQWSHSGTGDWVYSDFYQTLMENYDVDGITGSQYNISVMSDVKNKYVRYAVYNGDGSNTDILNVNLARIH